MNQTKDNGGSLELKRTTEYDPIRKIKIMCLDAYCKTRTRREAHFCITDAYSDLEMAIARHTEETLELKWQIMEHKLREYIGDRPDTDYQI